jgi:hypothetical protein
MRYYNTIELERLDFLAFSRISLTIFSPKPVDAGPIAPL